MVKQGDNVIDALDPEDSGNPVHLNQTSPSQFLKHMDTNFEDFFYKRKYTERNFCFYLQVLAQ